MKDRQSISGLPALLVLLAACGGDDSNGGGDDQGVDDTTSDAVDSANSDTGLEVVEDTDDGVDTDADVIPDDGRDTDVAETTDVDASPDADTDAGGELDDVLPDETDSGSIGETWRVEFTSASDIVAGSAAFVDEAAGVLTAPVLAIESAGDGADGTLVIEDESAATALLPGDYSYTDVQIGTSLVTCDGDITIRSTGTLTLRGRIHAAGHITLVADGAILIDTAELFALGGVRIHQTSSAGIIVQGGTFVTTVTESLGTPDSAQWPSGAIDIRSRGAVNISRGALQTGATPGLEHANIAIRAGGSLFLSRLNLSTAAEGESDNSVLLASGGDLTLTDFVVVSPFEGGGAIELRAEGNVSLVNRSFLENTGGAPITIFAEGDVLLDESSFIDSQVELGASTPVVIEARSLSVQRSSFIEPGMAERGTAGADVTIGVSGSVRIGDDSHIGAGAASCAAAGSLIVTAGGRVNLGNSACLIGGASTGATSCPAVSGGGVEINVANTLELVGPMGASCPLGYLAGAGVPAGEAVLLEGPLETPVVPDSGLDGVIEVLLPPVALTGGPGVIGSFTANWATEMTGEVWFAESVTEEFSPARLSLGSTFANGAVFRVVVPWNMFDAGRLDRIEVGY